MEKTNDRDFFFFCRDVTFKVGPDIGSSSLDMYSKAQKERLDNLDQANQEIDRLRKTIEKLQSELQGMPVFILFVYSFYIKITFLCLSAVRWYNY